jgi:ATP phosphoribosyltransferase regulatory subunit
MAEDRMYLKGEEKVLMQLRSLYASYGYRTYKMSRFEEYDLYAGNKDFLVSGNVITFTDTDGKLLALKPDVTLSIVKSIRESKGAVARVCYDENVYRVSDRSGTFREIMQAGVECIGDVGPVEIAEVVGLAQKSLKEISDSSILTLSHMGVVKTFLRGMPEELSSKIIEAIAARNVPAIDGLKEDYPEFSERLGKLSDLTMLMGTNEEIYGLLRKLGVENNIIDELKAIVSMLDQKSVRIDFSVLGGMKYYNGITFRGYVEGVPVPVVSGGQYDKLMARMGRNSKAIGFAVYMDPLERILETTPEYDVDVVLVYRDSDRFEDVVEKADSIRATGRSVVTLKEIPFSLRCREVITVEGGAINA